MFTFLFLEPARLGPTLRLVQVSGVASDSDWEGIAALLVLGSSEHSSLCPE